MAYTCREVWQHEWLLATNHYEPSYHSGYTMDAPVTCHQDTYRFNVWIRIQDDLLPAQQCLTFVSPEPGPHSWAMKNKTLSSRLLKSCLVGFHGESDSQFMSLCKYTVVIYLQLCHFIGKCWGKHLRWSIWELISKCSHIIYQERTPD